MFLSFCKEAICTAHPIGAEIWSRFCSSPSSLWCLQGLQKWMGRESGSLREPSFLPLNSSCVIFSDLLSWLVEAISEIFLAFPTINSYFMGYGTNVRVLPAAKYIYSSHTWREVAEKMTTGGSMYPFDPLGDGHGPGVHLSHSLHKLHPNCEPHCVSGLLVGVSAQNLYPTAFKGLPVLLSLAYGYSSQWLEVPLEECGNVCVKC